jgi:hypothetical protein
LRYAGKPIKITIEVRDERGTRLTGASATFHVERGVAAASLAASVGGLFRCARPRMSACACTKRTFSVDLIDVRFRG